MILGKMTLFLVITALLLAKLVREVSPPPVIIILLAFLLLVLLFCEVERCLVATRKFSCARSCWNVVDLFTALVYCCIGVVTIWLVTGRTIEPFWVTFDARFVALSFLWPKWLAFAWELFW